MLQHGARSRLRCDVVDELLSSLLVCKLHLAFCIASQYKALFHEALMVSGSSCGPTPPVLPMSVMKDIAGYTAPRIKPTGSGARLYGHVCKHLRDMNLPYTVRHTVDVHVVDIAFPDIKVGIDVLEVQDDPIQIQKAKQLQALGWQLIEIQFLP